MKKVVDNIGPLIISLDQRALLNYRGGIINFRNCSTTLNHNALLVGYGTDSATKLDYWIVKNSYGSNWGENGYFRIARGVNMCGIGKSAIYLCRDKECSFQFNNQKTYPRPKENCQCGGKEYLGNPVCATGLGCFQRTEEFFQCSSENFCPKGWKCNNQNMRVMSSSVKPKGIRII